MTDNEADRLDDLANLEAESRSRLKAMQLERIARHAGHGASAASLQDAAEELEEEESGTHRCPHCGYRFEPDPLDWMREGPEPSRLNGDGPQDQFLQCPCCSKKIYEQDLEEVD